MSDVILKIENLSKQYRLGVLGTGTISHDLNRWWYKVRGKEDPYLKIGESNDRSKKGDSEYVWALKDISFEVNNSEILGIIGKNGAGKSTLLKILSKVTGPTTGSVKTKGRIASLLEVGTGFHPEMTGKENIFLNGAILGMTKNEIKDKLEEIIEFSGCERYIDTPVKRYSSGMKVRLAFAVAAFLEPDILVVDEVLAVGDVEFQKKAIGKMQDISNTDGRTVLFVSHNIMAVKTLCSRALLIENGMLKKEGSVEEIVDLYLKNSLSETKSFIEINENFGGVQLNSIKISDNNVPGCFDIKQDLKFKIDVTLDKSFKEFNINLFFTLTDKTVIFATCSESSVINKGSYVFECIVPANTLNNIVYGIDLMIVNESKRLGTIKELLVLKGVEGKRESDWIGKYPGMIRPTYFNWKITQNE